MTRRAVPVDLHGDPFVRVADPVDDDLRVHTGKGVPTLADPGYEGAGHGVHTPVKQPTDGYELDINTRTRNALVRALGERGFPLLTERWRTLQHVTLSPSKISKIARAALVLTHFEHGYLAC